MAAKAGMSLFTPYSSWVRDSCGGHTHPNHHTMPAPGTNAEPIRNQSWNAAIYKTFLMAWSLMWEATCSVIRCQLQNHPESSLGMLLFTQYSSWAGSPCLKPRAAISRASCRTIRNQCGIKA